MNERVFFVYYWHNKFTILQTKTSLELIKILTNTTINHETGWNVFNICNFWCESLTRLTIKT